MKYVSAVLSVVVLLLIGAFLLQHRKTAELEKTLASERDAIARQLEKQQRVIAELQARPTASVSSSEAPKADRAAAAAAPAEVLAEPVATPGVTIKAPEGWARNGRNAEKYVVGVDSNETWGGMPSAYVKSLASSVEGFGGMMQTTAAENYVGKRVRLSGWVKTAEANQGGGHLWLRVDGEQRGQSLQFDNMNNRAVRGTTDWTEASVVLDVPNGASALAYGFFVEGGGQMWVSGMRIEEVGPDVPSTNMLPPAGLRSLPKTPRNLGFYP